MLLTAAADDGKIVGGDVMPPNSVPYIVNIKRSGSIMCGGSLVSPGYIITAAHCEYK